MKKYCKALVNLGVAFIILALIVFLVPKLLVFFAPFVAGWIIALIASPMAARFYRWVLVPVGALIGYFIVKAEPAVYVLNHQVEELTDGAISARSMGISLSVGVSLSVALAMIRVLTGIPILWFLIPGYGVAIGLSFFVPKIFTAIAFDSGGVASGPMTATFLLPLAQGACVAVGGNLVADAFGVVAMVAMTPLITIQILGMVYQLKQQKSGAGVFAGAADAFGALDENAIIEL